MIYQAKVIYVPKKLHRLLLSVPIMHVPEGYVIFFPKLRSTATITSETNKGSLNLDVLDGIQFPLKDSARILQL